MESKRLFVDGVKTESGKVLVTSSEVARELARLEGIEATQNKDNVIYLSKFPEKDFNWDGYEYVDDPNNIEKEVYDEKNYSNGEEPDKYGISDFLIDMIEESGVKSLFDKCIEDGTKIIRRIKKGGKKR